MIHNDRRSLAAEPAAGRRRGDLAGTGPTVMSATTRA